MNICLLFWILLPAAECGSHSLEFLSTGRVQPGSGLHFEQVTEFDGVVISHCDSGTQQEHFKPVLESHNLPGTCRPACYDVFDALKAISKFINHTRNVQRRRGCITSDERLESAFDNWAVNGEGFIQFDAGAQKWKALSPSAEMIKDSWNGREARNHLFGQFIRRHCLEMIHQIKLREVEKRTDLRVFANPVDRTKALLKCHVTSTKSVRSVSLTEDGAPKANWITVTGPLPSGDGSVILILTAEVPLIHTNIYGCVVQTEDRNITVMWDGNTLDGREILYATVDWPFWKILTVSFSCVCLLICTTALVLKHKKKLERRMKMTIPGSMTETEKENLRMSPVMKPLQDPKIN
ncbi:RLA class II histocompatibility antigen, DP beta chain-like isoform X2 [Takifugu flavidus]|uniref:RLA class II histocompatibility antigen, DP beta chain-like isoform X2 n=1 Tax=Takifugu flavidus TaxID=433684 RepID=UPI002544A5B0|nr:RLA class II histocompatibility antigen, DP beta chain-like isoform X2 [Takifugu flavidus]